MRKTIVSVLMAFLAINLVYGQDSTLNLWPDGIPGVVINSNYIEQSTMSEGIYTRFEKVTNPMLFLFLPPKEKASGTAVLICPGGGYSMLAFNHEGIAIAKWLNENGIAGIILKYRLPSDLIMKDKSVGPLQDAQEALRVIRRNATGWNINPSRIGVVGFSAGGHLASTLSTHFAETVYDVKDTVSARPDFSILIYPVITFDASFTHAGSRRNLIGDNPSEEMIRKFSNELQITDKTPPTFIVHSGDDKTVPVKNSIVYYDAIKNYNTPSELHIFEKGGHGYGLSVNSGTQSVWPDLCLRWMHSLGF
jgi:acetyl esterase/lipase